MELFKGIGIFVGWLTSSLAGIGAILYACGYLLTTAQLHMLGLSGLVSYGQERYVEEGGRFLIAVIGLLGEIVLDLLLVAGAFALPLLLVFGPIAFFKRKKLWQVSQIWTGRVARFHRKWPWLWRSAAFSLLLILLLVGSEDPQTFGDPLEISSLLYAGAEQGKPVSGLTLLLLKGDGTKLKAFFANSLLMELKVGALLLLAWEVTSPWRLRPLLTAPFFLIFLLYVLLLPMLYGVLQRQIQLPLVTLTTTGAWPGGSADKLFLLNKTEHEFVLWDAHGKKVLWLPVDVVKAAQIRAVQPLFTGGDGKQARGAQ